MFLGPGRASCPGNHCRSALASCKAQRGFKTQLRSNYLTHFMLALELALSVLISSIGSHQNIKEDENIYKALDFLMPRSLTFLSPGQLCLARREGSRRHRASARDGTGGREADRGQMRSGRKWDLRPPP